MNTAQNAAAMTAESAKAEKIDKAVENILADVMVAAAKGESEIKTKLDVNPVEKQKVYERINALGFEITEEEDGDITVDWHYAKPALPQISFTKGQGSFSFIDCDGERQVIYAPYDLKALCVEHGPSGLARIALYINGDVFELVKSNSLSLTQLNLLSEEAEKALAAVTCVCDNKKQK